ncbi:DEAD/DEAH box helicase [Klenkia sp. LSe6-5]|uniref:DEAD/DEAH box helicase n=1 Tax=Klenkia sesuvii TaxID=3103137 RepID=A0ABU8DUS2_9ACTN
MTAALSLPLDEEFLASCFGDAVTFRGRECLRERKVRSVTVHAGDHVGGVVTGSRGEVYQVAAFADLDEWVSRCTCPVVQDCKHAVAVLLSLGPDGQGTAVDQAGELVEAWPAAAPRVTTAPRPAWETALADLTPSSAATDLVPVGLQFELNAGTGRAGQRVPVQVRLRPVVPGRAGRWVRTGVSWRDLPFEHGPVRRVPEHRDVLVELYRAAQSGASGGYGYYGTTDAVFLDDVGPQLWRLLREARRAGVTFVTAKTPADRVVLEGPAPLRMHATASAAGDLLLEGVLGRTAGPTPLAGLTLVGTPVHGAFVVDDDALHLVPFADRVPVELSRMVSRFPRLEVPAPDVPRVRAELVPALQRMVELVSPDGSVELPSVQPPVLALAVRHADGARLTLEWSVVYPEQPLDPAADGVPGGRRLALTAAAADPGRDARAERALLGALVLPDGRFPQLRQATVQRGLVPTVELRELDAAVFCEGVLPTLRDQGVRVEELGDAPDYRAATSAPVVSVSVTDPAVDSADWFDLGITVTVDGQDVPFAHLFRALATKQAHLFLPSGTYFPLDGPEFAVLSQLIAEAGAMQDPRKPPTRINRWQAGLWGDLRQLGVVAEQSARWERSTAALLELDELPVPDVPAAITAQLRPYQLEGYRWLSFLWDHDLGGVLADDMGLGKTLQALALLQRAKDAGQLTAPVLVVAPTSVVGNWVAEAARFAPGLRVTAVEETSAKAGVPLAGRVAGADLVITSYTLLRLDEDEYAAQTWRGMLLDEAQFVKNRQAKAYRAARTVDAPFKLAITGTPMENSLMDLWSLLSICAPGLFPDPEAFNELWRRPIERGTDPGRLGTLRRRLRPLMLRRTKELVAADLPAKQEQVLEVRLTGRHETLYRTALQRERRKVLRLVEDMDAHRFEILRSLTLLRQLALDPALADPAHDGVRSDKSEAFLEHLREVLAEGHRVLVFSQFTGYLARIRAQLDAEGVGYAYLDGSTRQRPAVIQSFTDGHVPVFLISLKAGGFGLNLTAADYVFVLDPWWNPAAEAQAVDRAHRIGQTRNVMVYRLVAKDTIEEKVMALKARKQAVFDQVVDDDGVLSAPLTADDVRGLFD